MAKIKHTKNENGQNFTHQNKTTLFWRKKAKINLHQNFPIYGISTLSVKMKLICSLAKQSRKACQRVDFLPIFKAHIINYIHVSLNNVSMLYINLVLDLS